MASFVSNWEAERTKLVQNGKIKRLRVQGDNKWAYYVPFTSVRFRHRGVVGNNEGFRLPVVLLGPIDLSRNEVPLHELEERVAVYYSSSGTGKTVELVGTSHTRKTMLSFYTILKDNEEIRDQKDPIARNSIAMNLLRNQLQHFFGTEDNRIVLEAVLSSAIDGERKISICIDEASCCPLIVRSIMSDLETARETVKSAILDVLNDKKESEARGLRIHFVVGGTGAISGTIGSMESSYKYLMTSASADSKQIYTALLGEIDNEDLRRAYSYENIIESPLLKVLVDGNARMTSILVGEIEGSRNKRREWVLLENTLKKFIKSNGLNTLTTTTQKCLAAAQAIAIFLFQKTFRVPDQSEGTPEKVDRMEYHGVEFDEAVYPYSSKDLVAAYGLLVPKPFPRPTLPMQQGFELPAAMQLMTMYLMGFSDLSPLVQSSLGFGVLSTQMIKCAIAAALTVRFPDRPNLKDILCSKLKFQLPASEQNCTPEAVSSLKNLQYLKPVRFGTTKEEFKATRMQLAEATIRHRTLSNCRVERNLFFERDLGDALCELYPVETVTAAAVEENFCPPICSIACGSSDLVDGYVTFFVRDCRKQEGDDNGAGSASKSYKDWSTEQVMEWLGATNPAIKKKYEKGFRDEGINGGMLKHVGDSHLEEDYGVTCHSDRKLLLDAIRELKDGEKKKEAVQVKEAAESRGEDNSESGSSSPEAKAASGIYKMSILNQAKDYNDNLGLKNEHLERQAPKCSFGCLKKMFGRRIYCVASRKDAWELKKEELAQNMRAYVGFDVSESELLGNEVIALAGTRNQGIQDRFYGKEFEAEEGQFFLDYLNTRAGKELKKNWTKRLGLPLDNGETFDRERFLESVKKKLEEEEEAQEQGDDDKKNLDGMVFAIAAHAISTMKRADFVAIVEEKGGVVKRSVTKDVTHLICASDETAQAKKANEAGLEILKEEDVIAMVASWGEDSKEQSNKRKTAPIKEPSEATRKGSSRSPPKKSRRGSSKSPSKA